MTGRSSIVVTLLVLPAAGAHASEAPNAPPDAAAKPAPAADAKPDVPATGWAGTEACVACHDDEATAFDKTPHAAALADPALPVERQGCEACHGPGQAHVDEGGGVGVGNLESFDPAHAATARSKPCLVCHAGAADLHQWKGSAHSGAGLACTDCHRIHFPAEHLLRTAPPKLCMSCHPNVRAEFALPERHQVSDGPAQCLACHAVHGSRNRPLLREPKDRTCTGCHVEIEGPWVFEHEGLAVEGCLGCHVPHGSTNRHLLKLRQVAQLCLQCHTVTPTSHAQPSYRDCTRCHTAIHGSNTNPRLLEP